MASLTGRGRAIRSTQIIASRGSTSATVAAFLTRDDLPEVQPCKTGGRAEQAGELVGSVGITEGARQGCAQVVVVEQGGRMASRQVAQRSRSRAEAHPRLEKMMTIPPGAQGLGSTTEDRNDRT